MEKAGGLLPVNFDAEGNCLKLMGLVAKKVRLTENILYPNTQVKQKIRSCETDENISPVMRFTGDIGVGVM